MKKARLHLAYRAGFGKYRFELALAVFVRDIPLRPQAEVSGFEPTTDQIGAVLQG